MAAELEYYKEHLEHGRHIEVQRTTIAGVALTASGGIIGELLKKTPLTRAALPYTMTLLFLGGVAWLLSAKLYERFKLHNEIAKQARDKLDPSLAQLRKAAELVHGPKFPFTYPLPLHRVWYCLFGLISALGLGLTIAILVG